MKKDSIVDYSSYILLRLLNPLVRALPLSWSLSLGKALGELLYIFDGKHRAKVYTNVKTAFGEKLSPKEIKAITRRFYFSFGQNIIELFLLPSIDKNYINKYVGMEGRDNITKAFSRGKGVIFVAMHAGSWELSNIVCANLGFPLNILVREQRFPRLDRLLNSYRLRNGCKLIQTQNQTRQLIEVLKNNEGVGMTCDQGGKTGELTEFFGKPASMSTGALRLALKYDIAILPSFYARIAGPYHKVIVEEPFELKRTNNKENDLKVNLERLNSIFERLIAKYPHEYLWTYKVWKYSSERKALILSDGKAGHLKQSQVVAGIISKALEQKGIKLNTAIVEVKFKNNFKQKLFTLGSCFSGKYNCQGCLWCFRKVLTKETYDALISSKPDFVVSSGSSLAAVNYIISRENSAKSIAVMKPSLLSTNRFDLVIMPKHDNPLKRKNVIITDGALNLIDEDYLRKQSDALVATSLGVIDKSKDYIGLLLGGKAKEFSLSREKVLEVVNQLKLVCEKMNFDILATTSRRTSLEVEEMLKADLKSHKNCKLLVIANEKNLPEAVGGILGLSKIIVISPESISMISEAINSNKHVLVFKSEGLSRKHSSFLDNLAKNGYIYLIDRGEIAETIKAIIERNPETKILNDNALVAEGIKRIL
ncbi:MAG: ELM1/GtrOC1 family putative glycosyltransferase [Candidatus Omnitrophica bacterium]|nr:ELM1/GtrOC1 family putative glycosyltransferase [Candidatus Omnitrophota bacterium]